MKDSENGRENFLSVLRENLRFVEDREVPFCVSVDESSFYLSIVDMQNNFERFFLDANTRFSLHAAEADIVLLFNFRREQRVIRCFFIARKKLKKKMNGKENNTLLCKHISRIGKRRKVLRRSHFHATDVFLYSSNSPFLFFLLSFPFSNFHSYFR